MENMSGMSNCRQVFVARIFFKCLGICVSSNKEKSILEAKNEGDIQMTRNIRFD